MNAVDTDELIEWIKETFGYEALDPLERATRFLEEAIETAHAAGVDERVMIDIVDRVFSKPRGMLKKELGQVMLTLDALAVVTGINLNVSEALEFARVRSIHKETWQRRHGEKIKRRIAK